MQTATRLPGISFEAQARPPEAVLPRMDIAAFVGFAASGPLHTPVAIEDLGRFRELFGPDLTLAWDEQRGVPERSYLGVAVEAFMHNGGQRCWVVRVADADAPLRQFALPGLVPAGIEWVDADRLENLSARARARSAGTWANAVSVTTMLMRERLAFAEFIPALENYRLTLPSRPRELRTGELLEIVLGPQLPVLFLFVAAIEPLPQGTRLSATEVYWYLPVAASPATRQEDDWLLLDEQEGLARYHSWLGVSPAPVPALHALRFEIRSRYNDNEQRIGELAFHANHPRCWTHLPDDADLFRLYQGRQPPARDPDEETLRAQASSPRFALAGPDQPRRCYLPIGMSTLPAVPLEQAALDATDAGERVPHDGLERFDAALFYDPQLARLTSRALLAEAEHKYYLQQEFLPGLHSLLPVQEITLIAIPDAVHPSWDKLLPEPAETLPAPDLDPVPGKANPFGRCRIGWSAVAAASAYRLQYDSSALFSRPTTRLLQAQEPAAPGGGLVLPPNETLLALPDDCPRPYYFRVQALRYGEQSPWSNSRGRVLPAEDFGACQAAPIVELHLDALALASPVDTVNLVWSAEDTVAGDFEYELQVSADAVFTAARGVYDGPQTSITVALPLDATLYYRVRVADADNCGPWSNTVLLRPNTRSAYTLAAQSDYDDGVLLAIQRTLIRFCAARADLLGCLSLPRHYRERQVHEHLARLLPNRERSAASAAAPLYRDEAGALSYAALYHPWLALRAQDRADADERVAAIVYAPPDGAVLGQMAHQALADNAWSAPANRAITSVVALDPSLGRQTWSDLTALQVNLVVQEARGFLTLNAETLALSHDLRPINVRRLLILLRRLALREGKSYVFEPNSGDFRALVRHRFERLLSGLYVRGAFAGASPEAAYQVVADDSVNTRRSLDLGRFIIELRVAPSSALHFIKIRLLQAGAEQLQVEEI